MHPRIRPATVLDLEAALAMKDAAWRETYGGLVPDEVLAGLDARRPAAVQRWEQRLLDGAYLWLALDGDDVVGVASAGPRHDDDDVDVLLELQMLYLLDRVKGTGLAQVLLTTTLGDVDAYLWVLAGNERAIAFYRKQGFEPDGATKSVAGMPGEVRELRMVRTSWAG
ncbi:GNAT family N-acetyltransferase [Propioniciclava sp.]|uniref:GNAT family N-acetyltransferase n=1 Tax=Propioniciclava sp. TaxID=2038686 RepID=UPI002604361F|nr:GNAT family N-acetyltransferase [Propioniciclava sp.]